MDLKGISPDALAEALIAAGHSPEEVNQAVGSYSQARYEPERVEIEPAWLIETDQEVKIGKDQHKLRLMNADDMRTVLPKVVQLAKHFIRSGEVTEDKVQDLLQKGSTNFFGIIASKLSQLAFKGKGYPIWAVSALEEVAKIATNDEREITVQDLVSLPPSQLITLLRQLYEVNKQDFLLLWTQVPAEIREPIESQIFTPILMIISELKENVTTSLEQTQASSGGQQSTGKSSSSSQSKKAKVSQSQK